MKNEEIRKHAKQCKVMLWQIAHELGVSEPTMTRKLRYDLSAEEKVRIIRIIDRLSGEQQ